MGSVYEAEPAEAGPHVAIKLIRPDIQSRPDVSSIGRFHREARAASAVDTEHIVRVLDFGTDPETSSPYMVMELLQGQNLEDLLESAGALRPETVLRIAAQVCVALEKAHQARVIHRDIKPANIFLSPRDGGGIVVKILDFGLAKIRPSPGAQTSGLTRSGGLLGSPRYMSPEQAKGARNIDFRTDLWSLGMVLYHALSGDPPCHEAKTLGELILTICTIPPRLSPGLHPWVPPEVSALVHRVLELDPEARFPSATAMLDAIRPLLPSGWDLDEGHLSPREGASSKRSEYTSLEVKHTSLVGSGEEPS